MNLETLLDVCKYFDLQILFVFEYTYAWTLWKDLDVIIGPLYFDVPNKTSLLRLQYMCLINHARYLGVFACNLKEIDQVQ